MCQKLIAVLKQTPKLLAKLNKTIIHEYPELEDLEITPSVEEQKFKSNKYGYNEVTVKAVNIEDLGIEENVVMDINGLETNNAASTNAHVLNKLITKLPEEINTSGWVSTAYLFYCCEKINTVPKLRTSNVTNMTSMFYYCSNLINVPELDTSNVTAMSNMFSRCSNLIEIPELNTSKVTNMSNMFSYCSNLMNVHELDASNVTSMNNMFQYCPELTNFGGLKDLGKAYTQKTNNYNAYKLDLSVCRNLTHESLINIINNLYDLNLTYDVANGGPLYRQSLVLGSTNKAKLTAEEIAIATNKGWNVS